MDRFPPRMQLPPPYWISTFSLKKKEDLKLGPTDRPEPTYMVGKDTRTWTESKIEFLPRIKLYALLSVDDLIHFQLKRFPCHYLIMWLKLETLKPMIRLKPHVGYRLVKFCQ
jgi:hypothetical protein